ncbi:MAG TPA: hypothetical protein DCE44_26030, partial [Verrucomicrobiales bacterium]|nr:hypothetical protein [Verrucomicrobiales bacterium]
DKAALIARDPKGDVIVTGTTEGGISGKDILTIKYSGTDGVMLWSSRYGHGVYENDIPSALVVDTQGNVTVAGRTDDGGDNYYIAQYASADGALHWEHRHDNTPVGGTVSSGPLLGVDSDGNIFVGVMTLDDNGTTAASVAKYSGADGRLLWDKRRVREATTHEDFIHDLAVDAQGNVVISGSSLNPEGPSRYFTTKYAGQDGTLLWEQTTTDRERPRVSVDSQGNVIVVGKFTNDDVSRALYIAKRAAADGRLLWEMRSDLMEINPNLSLSGAPTHEVAVDTQDNILLTGVSSVLNPEHGEYEPGYKTVKYSAERGEVLWEQFRRSPTSIGFTILPQSISVDFGGNGLVSGFVSGDRENDPPDYADYYVAKYAAADGRLLWEQFYQGSGHGVDWARALGVDPAGNVFVTGESDGGLSREDFYTAKYAAADGALLWQQRYDGSADYESVGNAVTLDRLGNVVVTGWAGQGAYTAKYAAATGELLWEKRSNGAQTGGDAGTAVVMDALGDFVVAGFINSQHSAATNRGFVSKLSAADGTVIWEARLEGTAQDMKLDANGNVLVTGSGRTQLGSYHYTAKLAADGKLLWEGRYHRPASYIHMPVRLVVDKAGNVIVTGTSRSSAHNRGDFYTAKYSGADGALLWERRYDGPSYGDDVANAIAVDAQGNVVVTGGSTAGAHGSDFYTAKYAGTDGAVLWERRYNGPADGYDAAAAVAVDSSGNVLVAGSSQGGSGYLYTAKYAAADGALRWERRAGGIHREGVVAVTLDASGNVLVTGNSAGDGPSGSDSDYYTAMYASADGAVVWEKQFRGPAGTYDFPMGIAVGADGVVAVTGASGFDLTTVVYRETLPLISLDLIPNGLLLRFTGESGLTYRIERAISLNGSWRTLAAPAAPLGGKIEYPDTNLPPGTAFYRVTEY